MELQMFIMGMLTGFLIVLISDGMELWRKYRELSKEYDEIEKRIKERNARHES